MKPMSNSVPSMTTVAPIRRRKLYEEVVVRLEAMIHEGELNPGDLLPSERELMLHFGVGRPAIREALFALHRMGLVIVANGERPRVSSPTPKTMLGELAAYQDQQQYVTASPQDWQGSAEAYESQLNE